MKLFIIDLKYPWRPTREQDLVIKVCKKTVWAIDPKGRRHLLGSSAFQTLPAAERSRTASLKKILDSSWQKNHRYHAWKSAEAALVLH